MAGTYVKQRYKPRRQLCWHRCMMTPKKNLVLDLDFRKLCTRLLARENNRNESKYSN